MTPPRPPLPAPCRPLPGAPRATPAARRGRLLLPVVLAVLLPACSPPQMPETLLTDADRAAPFPDLVPAATILDERPGDPRLGTTTEAEQVARANALRNRAAQLRNTHVEEGEGLLDPLLRD